MFGEVLVCYTSVAYCQALSYIFMPPRKTSSKKIASPSEEKPVKKRARAKKKEKEEEIEDLLGFSESSEDESSREEIEMPAKHHSSRSSAVWWEPYYDSIHWAGVGIFAAMAVAAVILGLLLSSPACSTFMQKFLHPWKMPMMGAYIIPEKGEEVVATSFIVTTDEKDAVNILARAVETDTTVSAEYVASGTAAAKDARSTGMVNIVNTTSRTFTFVATTRLMSKEGVLFRLKSQMLIPPNGTVIAEVIADVAGASGDIGPTTFILPGLSGDVQKQVYAESTAPMTGGSGVVKAVSDADISRAKANLRAQAAKEAIENFRAMVGGGERLLNDLVVSSETKFTVPEIGAPEEKFNAVLVTHSRALIFSESVIEELVIAEYMKSHPDADPKTLTVRNSIYIVQAYDTVKDRAEVRVEAEVIP